MIGGWFSTVLLALHLFQPEFFEHLLSFQKLSSSFQRRNGLDYAGFHLGFDLLQFLLEHAEDQLLVFDFLAGCWRDVATE